MSPICRECDAELSKAAEIAAGICMRCHDDDSFESEMEELGSEMEYRTCRYCGSGPMMIAANDKRCRFCRAAEVRAATLALTHAAATVAIEDDVDDREQLANDAAEEEEWRRQVEEDEYLDSLEVKDNCPY